MQPIVRSRERGADLTEPLTKLQQSSFLNQQVNNFQMFFLTANVGRNHHYNDANVSGADITVANKANKSRWTAARVQSSIHKTSRRKNSFTNQTGLNFSSAPEDQAGKHIWTQHDCSDDSYSQLDMGYSSINNIVRYRASGRIHFQP